MTKYNAWGMCVLVLLTLLHLASSDKNDPCVEPWFNEAEFVANDTQFVRLTNTSKYLYPSVPFQVEPVDGFHICRTLGLHVATVDNVEEYWHIVDELIDGKQLRKEDGLVNVLLAGYAADGAKSLGVYRNRRTNKPIPFHMFHMAKKNYYESHLNCLSIECDQIHCYFIPLECKQEKDEESDHRNSGAIPLCQYPADGLCPYEKPGTQHGVGENAKKSTLWKIGGTSKRMYFGSKIQKSWVNAKRECDKEGMKLLQFFKGHTAETENVMKMIAKYSSSRKSPPWDQAAWTSGLIDESRFIQNDISHWFHFASSRQTWSGNDYKGHWEWSDEDLVQDPNYERCMLVVSTWPATIRTVSCAVPNYFVCYVDKLDKKTSKTIGNGNSSRFDRLPHRHQFHPMVKTSLQQTDPSLEENSHSTCVSLGIDICSCKRKPTCRYDNSENQCMAKDDFCESLTFGPIECARAGGYYAVSGGVCMNEGAERGNCLYRKVIIAVNLGGERHTDVYGIQYEAQRKVKFADPSKISKMTVKSKPISNLNGVPKADEPLYQTYQWGKHQKKTKRNANMCVTYTIPARDSGEYELVLKTFEAWRYNRTFNVKFNGIRILRELNITAFTQKLGVAIDFLVNYKISEDQKVLLKGHPSSKIRGGNIPLSFCLGECIKRENDNFIMSAFSVVQFLSTDHARRHHDLNQQHTGSMYSITESEESGLYSVISKYAGTVNNMTLNKSIKDTIAQANALVRKRTQKQGKALQSLSQKGKILSQNTKTNTVSKAVNNVISLLYGHSGKSTAGQSRTSPLQDDSNIISQTEESNIERTSQLMTTELPPITDRTNSLNNTDTTIQPLLQSTNTNSAIISTSENQNDVDIVTKRKTTKASAGGKDKKLQPSNTSHAEPKNKLKTYINVTTVSPTIEFTSSDKSHASTETESHTVSSSTEQKPTAKSNDNNTGLLVGKELENGKFTNKTVININTCVLPAQANQNDSKNATVSSPKIDVSKRVENEKSTEKTTPVYNSTESHITTFTRITTAQPVPVTSTTNNTEQRTFTYEDTGSAASNDAVKDQTAAYNNTAAIIENIYGKKKLPVGTTAKPGSKPCDNAPMQSGVSTPKTTKPDDSFDVHVATSTENEMSPNIEAIAVIHTTLLSETPGTAVTSNPNHVLETTVIARDQSTIVQETETSFDVGTSEKSSHMGSESFTNRTTSIYISAENISRGQNISHTTATSTYHSRTTEINGSNLPITPVSTSVWTTESNHNTLAPKTNLSDATTTPVNVTFTHNTTDGDNISLSHTSINNSGLTPVETKLGQILQEMKHTSENDSHVSAAKEQLIGDLKEVLESVKKVEVTTVSLNLSTKKSGTNNGIVATTDSTLGGHEYSTDKEHLTLTGEYSTVSSHISTDLNDVTVRFAFNTASPTNVPDKATKITNAPNSIHDATMLERDEDITIESITNDNEVTTLLHKSTEAPSRGILSTSKSDNSSATSHFITTEHSLGILEDSSNQHFDLSTESNHNTGTGIVSTDSPTSVETETKHQDAPNAFDEAAASISQFESQKKFTTEDSLASVEVTSATPTSIEVGNCSSATSEGKLQTTKRLKTPFDEAAAALSQFQGQRKFTTEHSLPRMEVRSVTTTSIEVENRTSSTSEGKLQITTTPETHDAFDEAAAAISHFQSQIKFTTEHSSEKLGVSNSTTTSIEMEHRSSSTSDGILQTTNKPESHNAFDEVAAAISQFQIQRKFPTEHSLSGLEVSSATPTFIEVENHTILTSTEELRTTKKTDTSDAIDEVAAAISQFQSQSKSATERKLPGLDVSSSVSTTEPVARLTTSISNGQFLTTTKPETSEAVDEVVAAISQFESQMKPVSGSALTTEKVATITTSTSKGKSRTTTNPDPNDAFDEVAGAISGFQNKWGF